MWEWIISYKSQNMLVLFDTSHDDFDCLDPELQHFFLKTLIFQSQKLHAF